MRTAYLELLQSETTAGTHAHVVALRLAPDHRSQKVGRARGHLRDAGGAGLPACLLLQGLVEPCLHTALPLLAEVGIGYHVVMLNHGVSRTAKEK